MYIAFVLELQGRLLEQDTSRGIIMSTQSLVLQHVEVEDVGEYTCRAINSEGIGESNPVQLKIMCKSRNCAKSKASSTKAHIQQKQVYLLTCKRACYTTAAFSNTDVSESPMYCSRAVFFNSKESSCNLA